uniref:Protein kinase domain-containing protein n=1 Tax=viral metagenome TaxID=1070528 RepID=A0A6C0I5D8_9ZZZZ
MKKPGRVPTPRLDSPNEGSPVVATPRLDEDPGTPGQHPVASGTFGCLYRPPLQCKNDQDKAGAAVNYDGKVSKLLKTTEASDEIDSYAIIQQIDPEARYYSGFPINCDIDIRQLKAIQNCKSKHVLDVDNIDELSLFQLNDGGMDINKYTKTVYRLSKSRENTNKILKFWRAVINLFEGLVQFKRGVVHHDLKPDNILYNEDTGRALFTDFGLTETRESMLEDAKEYGLKPWDYYPIEVNMCSLDKYKTMVGDDAGKQKLILDVVQDKTTSFVGLYNVTDPIQEASERYGQFLEFCRIEREKCREELSQVEELSRRLFIDEDNSEWKHSMITKAIYNKLYETFAQRLIDTFDIYGLGYTLLYFHNQTKRLLLPEKQELSNELDALCKRMIHVNPFVRFTPEEALDEYRRIITKIHHVGGAVHTTKRKYCRNKTNKK